MKHYFRRFFSIGRSGWESHLAKIVKEEKEKAEKGQQVLNKTLISRNKEICPLHYANINLVLLFMTDCETQTINIIAYIIPANESGVGASYAEYEVSAQNNNWR